MNNPSPASKFIEESVNHSEWLKIIESGQAQAITQLAREHGFECSLDELKQAARDLLATDQEKTANAAPNEAEIDEAAGGMSDFASTTGYGDDTGYAALYGVAGMILKS